MLPPTDNTTTPRVIFRGSRHSSSGDAKQYLFATPTKVTDVSSGFDLLFYINSKILLGTLNTLT